jgi:hypothetical protein
MTRETDPLWQMVESIPLRRLSQALSVIYLMYREGLPRVVATDQVATIHNIEYSTVEDKYCRQHGLRVDDFIRLYQEQDLSGLKEVLLTKNQAYHAQISEFVRKLLEKQRIRPDTSNVKYLSSLLEKMTAEEKRELLHRLT